MSESGNLWSTISDEWQVNMPTKFGMWRAYVKAMCKFEDRHQVVPPTGLNWPSKYCFGYISKTNSAGDLKFGTKTPYSSRPK